MSRKFSQVILIGVLLVGPATSFAQRQMTLHNKTNGMSLAVLAYPDTCATPPSVNMAKDADQTFNISSYPCQFTINTYTSIAFDTGSNFRMKCSSPLTCHLQSFNRDFAEITFTN